MRLVVASLCVDGDVLLVMCCRLMFVLVCVSCVLMLVVCCLRFVVGCWLFACCELLLIGVVVDRCVLFAMRW